MYTHCETPYKLYLLYFIPLVHRLCPPSPFAKKIIIGYSFIAVDYHICCNDLFPTGSHTVRRNDYENIFAKKKTVWHIATFFLLTKQSCEGKRSPKNWDNEYGRCWKFLVEIEQFPANFRVYAIALYFNVSISHINPVVNPCATVFPVTKR